MKKRKKRISRELLLSISILIMVTWAIYQVIYSRFAPNESVGWETTYYILWFFGVASLLLFIRSESVRNKLILSFLTAFLYVCALRSIYFLRFMGDYESYEQSAESGWLFFKTIGSIFLGSLIYGYKQWQANQ